MNIEIANRLVELRKKSGLSQEDLAAKLGLSRQAVSKWERAEASPDTDNLICLAKLYNVSLDDLLDTDQSVDDIVKEQVEESSTASSSTESATSSEEKKNKESSFRMNKDGIRFQTEDSEGTVDWKGVHIKSSDGSYTSVDSQGVHVKGTNGDEKDFHGKVDIDFDDGDSKRKHVYHVVESIVSGTMAIACLVAYLLLGFFYPDPAIGWGVCWLVFFLIPLVATFVSALRKRRFTEFAFPVLVAGLFILFGMLFGIWHPLWVIFLSIPLYYSIFGPIDSLIGEKWNKKAHISVHNFDDDDDDDDDNVIDVDAK